MEEIIQIRSYIEILDNLHDQFMYSK